MIVLYLSLLIPVAFCALGVASLKVEDWVYHYRRRKRGHR